MHKRPLMKQLNMMEIDTLRERENLREKLRRLAKLFNHREVGSYVTSGLESLAWEKIRLSFPALLTTPPAELIEKIVPDYMVGIILNCRDQFKIVEDPIDSEDDESGSETEEEESSVKMRIEDVREEELV